MSAEITCANMDVSYNFEGLNLHRRILICRKELTIRLPDESIIVLPAEIVIELHGKPKLVICIDYDCLDDVSKFDIFLFSCNVINCEFEETQFEAIIFRLDFLKKSVILSPLGTPLNFFTSKSFKYLKFNLFNFPNFDSNVLHLQDREWEIEINKVKEIATITKEMRQLNGCLPTHLGLIKKKNGVLISNVEFEKLHVMLNSFLTFVKGSRCNIVCAIGFDEKDAPVYFNLSAPYEESWLHNWCNHHKAEQVEDLFPLFSDKWYRSDHWSQFLRKSIYLYAQASTEGGYPSIDASIILSQAVLERLAYFCDKEFKIFNPYSKTREVKSAAFKINLMLSHFNISTDITPLTPHIYQLKLARDKKQKDVQKWDVMPKASSYFRNSLAHGEKELEEGASKAYYEVFRVNLLYVELVILALCGYQGSYRNRVIAKYTHESELVPWSKSN